MKFSIIIPVYNCESCLYVSVDSILNQSYRDFELILVNDGSSDDSLKVCDAYAEKDARIKVISQNNAGAGPARNHAISQSSGEYLVFCDADDYFETDALAYFAEVAAGEPDLIISSYQEFRCDKDGQKVKCGQRIMRQQSITNQEDARKAYLSFRMQNVIAAPWGKAYRRELVISNGIGFADLRRHQDIAFNLYFYEYIHTIEIIPEITYNYQILDGNSCLRKFPVNMFEIHKTIYMLTCESLKRWGVYNEEAKYYLGTHFQRDTVILLRLNYQNNWKMDRKQRRIYAETILNDPILVDVVSMPVKGSAERIIAFVLRTKSIRVVDVFS